MTNEELLALAAKAQVSDEDVVVYARSQFGKIELTTDSEGNQPTVQMATDEHYLVGPDTWKDEVALNLYDEKGDFRENAEIPEVSRELFLAQFPNADWAITRDSPVQ